MIILNFCFKELRFGPHADSIVMVDFLHVLGSIEGVFISLPNAFKQTLGLLCHNFYNFVNPSLDILFLGVFGVYWSVFVNTGRQGGVISFVESIRFF